MSGRAPSGHLRRGGLLTLIVLVVGVLAGGAVGVAHALGSRLIPVPAGLDETLVGANGYALGRLGGPAAVDDLSGRLLSLHVAVLDQLTGSAARHASVAGAVRELLLLVAVASALALITLARQLSLSLPAAVGAALLAGLPPVLVATQVLTPASAVALMWVLVAGVLAGARPTSQGLSAAASTVAAGLVVLAALLDPVIVLLPAGVLTAAAFSALLLPRLRGAGRVLLVVLALAPVLLVVLLDPDLWRPPAPAFPVPGVAIAVGVGTLLIAVATVLLVPWLRPVAVAAVLLAVVVLLPLPARAGALLPAVTVSALLVAALADESFARTRGATGPVWRRPLAVGLAVAAAVGVAVLPVPAVATTTGDPQLALAAWLPGNVQADRPLVVDPVLRVELLRAGVPAQRLTLDGQAGAGDARLSAQRLRPGDDPPAAEDTEARFGSGPLTIWVTRRGPDDGAARAAEASAGAALGAGLADNPNVDLGAGVADDLVSGRVDPRLLIVLAAAAADFRFTIAELPPGNGDPEVGTLRTVRLTDIEPTAEDPDASSPGIQLRDYFRYQLEVYRPLTQGFDDGVLEVTYAAPSPVGLLG